MATTFLQMQDDLLLIVGASTGAGATALRPIVKRALNKAAGDVYRAHEWPERKTNGLYLTTKAPYVIGTIQLTNGSTAVTGTGTVWVAGHTGMRLALSYDGASYVFTRTGATTGTLDRAYQGADGSGLAYVLYQDTYALDATVESLLVKEVVVHKQGGGPIRPVTFADFEQEWVFPVGAGTPDRFSVVDISSDLLRIRLGTSVPDAAYDIRYRGLKHYVDMSLDGDFCVVPEARRRIIIHGALREVYKVFHDWQQAAAEDAIFQKKIEIAKGEFQAETAPVVYLRPCDYGLGLGEPALLPPSLR